jgi:hypothetical protein
MNRRRVALIAAVATLPFAACARKELSSDARSVVQSVAYTRAGDLAVFTSREVVVYDRGLTTERARVAYPGMPDGASVLASELSADGDVAAVAWTGSARGDPDDDPFSQPAIVVAFRVPSGEALAELSFVGSSGWRGAQPTGELYMSMHLSPAGDLLAVKGVVDGGYLLDAYDVVGGALRWSRSAGFEPYVFASDGASIYTPGYANGDPYGLVSLDARTGEPVLSRPGIGGHELAVSADGRWVLATAEDGIYEGGTYANGAISRYSVWPIGGGETSIVFESPGRFAAGPLAMSPDGAAWASLAEDVGNDGPIGAEVHIWTSKGALMLNEPTDFVSCPAFAPDGTELAIGPIASQHGRAGVNVYRLTDGAVVATRALDEMTP